MEKLLVFFILAILVDQALGMHVRHKRQSNDDSEEDLEDRYALNSPADNARRQQFPGRFPGQNQQGQNQQQQQSTTQAPTGSTTLSAALQQCIQTCPVTSEYNPVCGSNNQLYSNPGRLICAQECGVNVVQARQGPCPAATAAPAN